MKMKRFSVVFFPLLLLACAHRHHHEGHGPIGHRFEKAEDWAKHWDDPSRDAWQRPEEVIALMQIAPGMVVADIGTGTGYFLPHLSRAVGESGKVLALDIEPDMIRYVKERAAQAGWSNVAPAQVPYDNPSLPPGGVHRVLIVNTWHHIPERAAYAEKIKEGLAEGGMLLVVDFTLESEMGPPKKERLSPETVAEELRAGGLEAEILEESLPAQYIVVGRKGSAPAPSSTPSAQ